MTRPSHRRYTTLDPAAIARASWQQIAGYHGAVLHRPTIYSYATIGQLHERMLELDFPTAPRWREIAAGAATLERDAAAAAAARHTELERRAKPRELGVNPRALGLNPRRLTADRARTARAALGLPPEPAS